ncbi:MAG: glycosyltransferase family 4 protein, partial [Tumebacillaceae bacterium]
MRILIVLPPNMPSGGNWTYSGRLQRGVKAFGIDIDIKPLDQVTEADYTQHDIIHTFNAYLTGRQIAPIAKRLGKPLVLTMTGTDVNEHLKNPETRPSMVEVVEYASRIVLLTEDAGERLAAQYPSAGRKSQVINLGIDLPAGRGKTRADFGIGDDEFVFLLVAGIRGVKRPLDAFAPLSRVHEQFPNVRFLLAGSVLDQELFEHIKESFAATDFARYIGEFPYEDVSDLYRAGDVIMNTSSSEG